VANMNLAQALEFLKKQEKEVAQNASK